LVVADPKAAKEGSSFPVRISLEQRILPTDYVGAKIHNIEIARSRLENVPIPPEAIFSFWRIVGRPTRSRGFQAGRSLLGGQLRPDYGGGLCQLSGMLYHLSLLAGLRVLERHPHSRDIYDDKSRFAPLGSDATVAFGFKDFRMQNNLPNAICFRISISPEKLGCFLCSPAKVKSNIIEFVKIAEADGVSTVETRHRLGDAGHEILCTSSYQSVQAPARAHEQNGSGG
jgi:vancomycin resistance protein VanW